jgi:hypothetical protein
VPTTGKHQTTVAKLPSIPETAFAASAKKTRDE